MNKDVLFENERDLLSFLRKRSESCLFSEICGLVGINKEKKIIYREMPNRSQKPEQIFIIDAYDYLNFISENEAFCVFHSHLHGDEEPSDFDIKTSENCCYLFLIYSINTEKFFLYEPKDKDYDVNIAKGIRSILNEHKNLR